MGKSKNSAGDCSEAVKSLFSIDNPFRRKAPTDAPADFTINIPQQVTKLGLAIDSSANKREIFTEANVVGDNVAKSRKRKRDRGIKAATPSPPSSDEDPVTIKRKKLVVVNKGEEDRQKKKRKRDEVQLEHEEREKVVLANDVAVGEKRKAPDVVATDMVDSIESFDDESKLLRTVFVGNLPLKIKRKALNREFGKFGEIESIRIRSVPLVDTKAPRKAAVIMGKINTEIDSVNAYIVFKDEQSAQAALSQNMAQVGGNHIRVDIACPPRKKMKGEFRGYDRKKTAFVGNLPFDVKDEELYQLFCGLNPSGNDVEAVRVIRDPSTSAGKGIAYVLFKTRDAANKVCKRRDLKIRDRYLRICHAKPDIIPLNKVKEDSSRTFSHRSSPAAVSGDTPSQKTEKRKRESSASVSYEGTRSSKKGAVNKTVRRFPANKTNNGSTSSSRNNRKGQVKKRPAVDEQKGHVKKRPAVAARKAKQLKKRKQAGGTPENTHRNKRVRRQ